MGTRMANSDSRGWIISRPPLGVSWSDYTPRRIRPIRLPNGAPSNDWIYPPSSLRSAPIRLASDGPSSTWLSERDAAGTETNYRYRGNRIEKALVKEQSPLVITLRRLAELMRPAATAVTVDIQAGGEEDASRNTGFGTERLHNQGAFNPSIPELMQALSDGMRTRVVRDKSGKLTRISPSHHFSQERNGLWHRIGSCLGKGKLTGLEFFAGEMVAYGDNKGRKRQPDYNADHLGLTYEKESVTARQVERQEDENRSYLSLPAASKYEAANDNNAPRALGAPPKTGRAARAAKWLSEAANDNVPVTRLPDGVAAGYGRLAGISEPKPYGATSTPRHEALDEMDRAEAFAGLGLDTDDWEVIDAVLDDESFRTIGLRRGHAESSAHKSGRRAVEAALRKISEKIAA